MSDLERAMSTGADKGCLNSLFRVEETTPAAKKPRLSLGWHAETNSATSSARVVEAAPAAVARNLLSFGMAELETPPKHDRQLTHQELRDDMVLSGILAGASTECVRGSMANASDRSESCEEEGEEEEDVMLFQDIVYSDNEGPIHVGITPPRCKMDGGGKALTATRTTRFAKTTLIATG